MAGPTPRGLVAIAWAGGYEAARAEARAQRRLALVFFFLEGRPMVEAMEAETLSREPVAAAVPVWAPPVAVAGVELLGSDSGEKTVLIA
jgi:hypothetical protein